jgi:TRAP-type C4-dicarboxylate transport system permease small subunit
MADARAVRLLRMLHRAEDALLALVLGVLVLLACGQILSRLLFDAGWSWVEPSMRLLILWLAMLGALAATRERRHIAIDLLPRMLPPLGRRLTWALGQLFAAGICVLLGWGSLQLVLLEHESETLAVASLPTWAALLILPLGFGLMALRMLVAALAPPASEPLGG